ncbi:hypothetical protein F5B20DRAFT_220047 [Whalleya microplaca]|nr:hypothetical protein F5B20DRAFT_220047 [Whalleya microplaca]
MDTVVRLVPLSDDACIRLYLGAGIPAIIIAASFVAIRLSNSWVKAKKFFIEDYIFILALLLLAVEYQIKYYGEREYERRIHTTKTITYLASTEIAQTIISAFLCFFAKIPIFILYIRLFGIMKWVRLISYATIIATLLQFVAGSSMMAVQCTPKGHVLDGDFVSTCLRWESLILLWNGIIAVITDLVLFVIPFPIIANLQLPRNKKTGLAIMFLVGILGIAVGSFSLYWRIKAFSTGSRGTLTLVLSTTGECSIAIVIGCVPAIPPLWGDHISKSALYLRIRSAFSPVPAPKCSSSQSSVDPLKSASDHEANRARCYIELYDERSSKAYGGINYGRTQNWVT